MQQSSRNYPVATIQSQAIQSQSSKRRVSTKPDDVALLPRLVPQFPSWSPSRNTSATTDFSPLPPAARYSNHQIPNPTSRWLEHG
ncbi:hypothetical protein F511_34667 [Dorcoceras hygrometricum]|uniref:Uncharacterized protein n=1 Tax=Dorcoceras hygrometricum TaxID=472368 RepID=A0A2Z7AKE0_9LAMI|nr:hypothetical protein F511_34667 [Dorcoceras hygrometricum]